MPINSAVSYAKGELSVDKVFLGLCSTKETVYIDILY